MAVIGFIGLGAMGSRLAGRLLASGHEVHGHNRTRERAEGLIERGLIWHETPRELAAASEVTLSMVSDDAALDAIAAGPEGLLAGLGPGKLYIDMSTVSPAASVALAARVQEIGAQMLDAPVSGSVPQAESGTLTIMVGGEERAFIRVEPLLAQLGARVVRVGANGQGLILKLAINISLAAQVIAFSEGLVLAQRAGIEPRLAADVMSESSVGSAMLRARVPLILNPPEQAWFDVALLHKDVRLALAAAGHLRTPVPSARSADAIFTMAERHGFAHRDIAAMRELLALQADEMAAAANVGEPASGA